MLRPLLLSVLRLLGLCAAALTALEPATQATTPASRPHNIVFILADDLGYGDVGCYGSAAIATPQIDALAREGTRFTDAYAGSPVCAPSRAVLMSGLHTGHTRIRNNSPRVGGTPEAFAGGAEGGVRLSLTASDRTIAEGLRAGGYATGISGKWGLAEPGTDGIPTRRGFDAWLGYLNQNHAAYHYPEYLDENDGIRALPENRQGRRGVYSNDLMTDFAVDFLQRHHDRPFFLYLPFTLPHARLEVPELGAYAARTDWPEEARIYAAMVTQLDHSVGRLRAELKRLKLDASTVVFFTSDNGPVKAPRTELLRSASHWRGRKGSVYEGGIRVPMIVRWPGRVPEGQVSSEPWSFADVAPTLLELAGLPVPAGFDGRSVLPVLTGTVASLGERPLYWEIPNDRLHQAVRLGPWKAVRAGLDQPLELYDLAADPTESTDVAVRHPKTVAKLRALLDSSHIPSPHWPVR